jgi:putative tryptophan/tyrosine transport system substrate-binding protein
MIDRRTFLAATGANLLAGPGIAYAQERRLRRVALMAIAIPTSGMIENGPATFAALLTGLRQRGYVEGTTIAYERWTAMGMPDTEFGKLAQRVTETQPDLIFVDGSRLVLAVKNATTSIPIVFTALGPLEFGLVQNLPHPGGNITGFAKDAGVEILGKQLQLLMEAKPGSVRVLTLTTPLLWGGALFAPIRDAAKVLGVQLEPVYLDGPVSDAVVRTALAPYAGQKDIALFQAPGLEFVAVARAQAEVAIANGWASIGRLREQAAAGMLLSYGNNEPDQFRSAADYIDRILKGSKPGDLPVQQPMRFDFVINLKTAKAIGVDIPEQMLVQATEVIE